MASDLGIQNNPIEVLNAYKKAAKGRRLLRHTR
jgi:hypothetical protein